MPELELRLLALDGGGVRGLSTLQILKQLMEVVDLESPPKPCDYFDMIGGTSTGGLIAIMLGRLRMTVDDCIDAYVSLSDRLSQKQRHRMTIKGNVQGRFDSDELERAIKAIVVRQGLEADTLLKDSPDAKCKVFVCATSKETSDTVRLTSYRSPRGRERLLRTTKIWEAGRATSAASSFFDSITIGDFHEGFVDGATGANNPVYEVWNEAQDMWPCVSLEENVKCLVSIGTGVPSLKPFPDDLVGVGQSLLAIATETEKTAERFCRDKSGLNDQGRYYRFNVLRGLEDIGLEDSKRKNAIIAATDRYIESQAVFKQMKACGNNLAERQYVGLYRVPFSLGGVPLVNEFVDRPSEIEGLEKHLIPSRRKQQRKVVVLSGLGGIGKTQLSIEFARRHQLRFSAVVWLDGRSEDGLKQSIAAVASRIPKGQIPESSRTHPPQNTSDRDTLVKDVLDWLSAPENNRWLVVFDNIDQDYRDPQAAADAYDVRRYFPRADHGSILITSRLVNLGQLGTPLQVGRVDNKQALAIFKNGYGREYKESQESKRLLRLLDGLPLALAQASAFMRETATSFAEYIQFYKGQWRELMDSHGSSQAPLQEYQNGSVWTTWTISYRAIQRRSKAATNLLLLWACLDSKDLWFELLAPAYKRLKTDECIPEWFRTVASSKLAFTQSIKLLLGYSLIEGTEGLSSYSTHPVVHEWAWQMQEEDTRAEYCWLAAVITGVAVPYSSEKEFWVMQRRLLPHADRCVRCGLGGINTSHDMQRHSKAGILTSEALHNIGILYADQGKLGEAEKMYQRALQGCEKALDAEHTSTLNTVNNLGLLYADQGKLGEAEKMYQRALQGNEKTLGAEHASTLSTVNNLGNLYLDQGKLSEAEKIYQQALQGMEKALGAEHTWTLSTVNNLGNLYLAQGKLGEAEKMYQRALQGKKKALGAEHTSTLDTVNNLGALYADQGKLGEAEKMYQRALQEKEKALGAEHTSTLDTVNNLGLLYADQGKLGEAEKMYQRALQGYEKALGVEHTSTLNTVNNLGNIYKNQGKLGEAEKMYLRALQGYEKALGTENLASYIPALNTVRNLGYLSFRQGDSAKARVMFSKALVGYEKVLGHDHPRCQRLQWKLRALDAIAENNLRIDTTENCGHTLEGETSHFNAERNPSNSKRHRLLRKLGLR